MGDEEVKRWHDIAEMVNRVEDALPADCPICGWGLPGPHHANCRLFAALCELASACHDLRAEVDELRAKVERITRERDYWRQQMELAGPELDRLRRNCPACGRSVDASGLCWPECHSAEADELRELAWRWCIEARAQLRRREADR